MCIIALCCIMGTVWILLQESKSAQRSTPLEKCYAAIVARVSNYYPYLVVVFDMSWMRILLIGSDRIYLIESCGASRRLVWHLKAILLTTLETLVARVITEPQVMAELYTSSGFGFCWLGVVNWSCRTSTKAGTTFQNHLAHEPSLEPQVIGCSKRDKKRTVKSNK